MKLDTPLRLIHAMALNISNDDGHPNKMPFSGVLTRIGEASDEAPHGSGGRLIEISVEAAEKAIPSILGMAVDYVPKLDGHDPKSKIGIITAARVEGNAILIEGFIYASDFPDIAAEIKANKDLLGFSYEARDIYADDPKANPLVVTDFVFTGAAILRKDKAAYHTTSLHAQRDLDAMTPEQEKMIADLTNSVAVMTENMNTLSASVAEIKERGPTLIEANASKLVEPHAKALESCASSMEAAGVGGHPEQGHAVMARRMAGHLRAGAAIGKVPYVFDAINMTAHAAIEKAPVVTVDDQLKPLVEKLAAMASQIADLKASAARESPPPARKTLPAGVTNLMAKAGLAAPADGGKMDIHVINEALTKAGVKDSVTRMEFKNHLHHAGLID